MSLRPLPAWWRDHLPLVVTGALFLSFLIKLAAVSHGDTTTMLGILRETAPAQALFGMAATAGVWLLLGLVGSFLVGLVLSDARNDRPSTRSHAHITGYAVAISMVASALMGALMLILGNAWAWRRLHAGQRSDGSTGPLPDYYFPSLLWVLILLVGASDHLWLPAEQIETANGDVARGYILNEEDETLVVLEHTSRTIYRIPMADVDSRSYCTFGGKEEWWLRPVYALRDSETPDYPACRDR